MSLQAVFEELIDLSPEQRVERLRTLSLTTGERERLKSMLELAKAGAPLLDVPVADLIESLKPDDARFAHLAGATIGPFKVLEMIGEGGSAVVYRASRSAGSGEQFVALKVLRSSAFSVDGERRFQREQAILAQLTHPNIARLIEGGVDSAGYAYIAMELVQGESITRAAAARKLGVNERLEWFLCLCRAIDAAHESLVVHCDLKPSNILVDQDGVLKVLDFGVARLIDASREDQPTRSIALTPEYAAPEQFQLGPPRISVDVYALGVILGELLTGQRLGAAARILPSIAVADPEAADPPAGLARREILARRLSGDLDAIVTMATEQEASNRYRSAAALAQDIERYLSGSPVLARFPTRRYRMRKFVGRHRVAVATTCLALLALITGLVVAWWQAVQAQRAAREALAQTARANSMRNMVFEVFSEAEPDNPQPEPTVTEAAERAISALLADRSTDPRARLELQARFADMVGRQGHQDRARELLERALAESMQTVGPADDLTYAIEERLADYEIQRGSYPAARERLDRLLAKIPSGATELRVKVLRASSSAAWRLRDRERALRDGSLAVALSHQLANSELERETLTYYGNMLLSVDAVPEAIDVYKELLELDIARFGPSHEQIALVYTGLGRAYRRLGDLEKAEDFARRALAIDRVIYPHDHFMTATHLNTLGNILVQRRDFEGALEASRESLRIADDTLDDKHIDHLVYRYQVGYVYYLMERYAEAIPYLRDALDRMSEVLGASHYRTVIARSTYGYAVALAGDTQTGAAELERAINDTAAASTPDFDFLAKSIEKRIRLALMVGDAKKAAELMQPLEEAAGKINAVDSRWWTGKVETLRGAVLLAQQRPQDAIAALQRAGTALEAQPSTDVLEPIEQRLFLASAYSMINEPAASRAVAIEARHLMDNISNPPSRFVKLAESLPR